MNRTVFSSQSENWYTPLAVFTELDKRFHFNLDPCADEENHKCQKYYTKEQDGLKQNWGGVQRVLQSPIRQKDSGMG